MKKIILIALIIILIVIISAVVYVRYIRRPAITKEHLEQRFSQIRKAYQVKLDQGYDLTEVLNYGKQALEAYKREDYQIADKLLNQAFISLERAKIPPQPIKQCPICSLPSDWSNCLDNKQTRTNYKCDTETGYQCQSYTEERSCESEIIKSNSWIMDSVTVEYEKPKSEYGGRQWWAWYAYAYNGTNELLLNANFYPLAIVLNGSSYTLNGEEKSFYMKSINWNETAKTLFGTMRRSDGVEGIWALRFPETGYRVYEQKIEMETLMIEFRSRGIPLWGGRTEDEMLKISFSDGTPIYAGGFHDSVTVHAILTRPEGTLEFNGSGIYDRAWLRPQPQTSPNLVLFFAEQPEFYINVVYVRNNYNTNEILVRTGRIGFPNEGRFYRFDNFTYYGLYGIRPQTFKLQGTFDGGTVDLTGERIGWLYYRQGHPFIRWTGTITKDGKTINVDALGSGEIQAVIEP